MSENEAKLLLLGMDALAPQERWLLAWLVDVGSDVGMRFLEYVEDAGLDFFEVCSRWREMGLLTRGYDWDRDCGLYVASERACQLVSMSAGEWVSAVGTSEPVDLDQVEVAA